MQAGNSPGDVPLLFFSRQIGLSQGQAVPVLGGARLTGRTGPYSIGALDIQTDDAPEAGAVSTNFSALRLKRNLFRRSNVGMIATRRGPGQLGAIGERHDASYSVGADATLLFFKSINLTSYYARTSVPQARGGTATGASYRGRFDYTDDRYGAAAEHMLIDRDFRPEVGFVRRTDVRRSFGQLRFSPRPDAGHGGPQAHLAGQLRLRHRRRGHYGAEPRGRRPLPRRLPVERSGCRPRARASTSCCPGRFSIAPGVVVPAGGYTSTTGRIGYTLGQQRRVSGRLSAATGTLYDGTKTELTYSGRWGVVPRFSIEPGADAELGVAALRRLHRAPGQRPLHGDADARGW